MFTNRIFIVKIHTTETKYYILQNGMAKDPEEAKKIFLDYPELAEGPACDTKEVIQVVECEPDDYT